MMYKTDIANKALGRLGVSSTITDIETDLSVEAKILKRHFRDSLDYLLEQHEWNFARRVATLNLQFENPEPRYAYSYYMPPDALVIRQIAYKGEFTRDTEIYLNEKIHWTEIFEGSARLMYTNLQFASAEYTKKVDENSVFPSHFGRALAALLSKDIAPSLITNNFPKISAALNSEADNAISHGIADDLARQPQYNNSESSFVRARY